MQVLQRGVVGTSRDGHPGGMRPRGVAMRPGVERAAVAVLAGVTTLASPAARAVEPPAAQVQPTAPSVAEPSAAPRRARDGRHSLEASYYGLNFLRPGAQVGYSFRALQSRRKLHALVVGADVGSYYWARHSIGVHAIPRVGWRGRHPKHGLQGEVNLHLGYRQGVLPSEAFEVVNGQVRSSGRAGYPYMVVGPTVGIGYFIESIGVTPFLRTGAHWQYPIFDQAVVRFDVALGVEVRL